MAFVSQGPLFGIDPHNTNTVHVGAWYGFFVCVFSLPIFRRQICFYLYFLVPGSSHSLFLKVFAGSAYLSQTDTWPRDRKPVRPLDSGSTHGRWQECSGSNSLPLVQWPEENPKQESLPWASLVVQWIRISLPKQRTWVWFLARKDPTCHTEQLSLCATTTEARVPRACAPQQENHSNEEPVLCSWRVVPTLHNLRKLVGSKEDSAQPKINKAVCTCQKEKKWMRRHSSKKKV